MTTLAITQARMRNPAMIVPGAMQVAAPPFYDLRYQVTASARPCRSRNGISRRP
jgi:hypothetical protein